jgi:hypothetical protein
MAENINTTSRRGMLAALAVTAMAVPAAASVLPAAAITLTNERAAWDAAFAVWQEAERVDAAYDASFYHPASEQVDRIAPRPDMAFTITATNGHSATYRWLPSQPDAYEDCFPQMRNAAAAIRRAWKAHCSARERYGMDDIETRSEELGEIAYDAKWKVFHTPAPDVAALLWKLEHLFGEDERDEGSGLAWDASLLDELLADARRLAGGLS